jgi:hypothetical protein
VAILAAKSALKESQLEYIRQERIFQLSAIFRRFRAIVPKMNGKGLVEGSKDVVYGKRLNRQFASFITEGNLDALYEIMKEHVFEGIAEIVCQVLQMHFQKDLDVYEKRLVRFLVMEEHA